MKPNDLCECGHLRKHHKKSINDYTPICYPSRGRVCTCGVFKKVAPDKIWILRDLSNGHRGAVNYLWWFSTKREAECFRREQNSNGNLAKLTPAVLCQVHPSDKRKYLWVL